MAVALSLLRKQFNGAQEINSGRDVGFILWNYPEPGRLTWVCRCHWQHGTVLEQCRVLTTDFMYSDNVWNQIDCCRKRSSFVCHVSSLDSYLQRKRENCMLVKILCDCPPHSRGLKGFAWNRTYVNIIWVRVLFQFHHTHTGHCHLLTIVKGLYCGYRSDCGAIEAFQFPRITTNPAQEEKSLFKSVYPSRVNIWECYIGSHTIRTTTTRRRRTQDTQSPQPPSAGKGEPKERLA